MGKGKELSKDAISAGDQPQPGSELRRASGITVHHALRQGGSSVSASHWAAWSAGHLRVGWPLSQGQGSGEVKV